MNVDFGQARPFNAIAIIDHNFTFDGTVTITASNTQGGSDLVNITVPVWQELIGYGEDRYGYLDYGGGKFFEEDRQYMVPRPIRVIYLNEHGYDEPIEARYLRLTFNDAGSSPDYFQFGRLLVGLYDDFGINFSQVQHEVLDDSDIQVVQGGGQFWGTRSPTRNGLSLSFDWLDYADKYWLLLHMGNKMGLNNDFLIDCFPDPDIPSERHWGTMYGRFTSLPSFSQDGESPFASERRTSQVDLVFEEAL